MNLNGAFYVTQAVAKQMKEQGTGGAIVATSSISALVGGGMQTHYTPTKAGVHSLMQSCAIALGPLWHSLQFGDAGHDRNGSERRRSIGQATSAPTSKSAFRSAG